MKYKWTLKKLSDIAEFNPKESIKKGTMAKKISMEKLQPFCRDIPGYEITAFTGGTKFRNGDTIMARITPCLENGKRAQVSILDDNEVGFGSTEYIVFRAKKNMTNADFLYYLVCSPMVREPAVKSMVGSSGRQRAQINVIERIEVAVPPLEEQQKIGSVLRALDDKIELNNRINDNLEQQISEIYKAWYQDFSCAVNVPMVASEYGIIPQGWHYSMLSDLCKSISVTHKFDSDKLIFLNTGDIKDGRFLHENYMIVSEMPGQAKKSIALGDILFSEIRPTNRHFAYVNFPAKDYVVSTKLMVIRTTSLDSRRLYHFLTSEDVLMELQMQAESRSGTFPQIRFDNVSKLPILIADDKTEAAFTDLLHTVYTQIEHNNLENGKLRTLRDNLLPRLMSGELDVSELDI